MRSIYATSLLLLLNSYLILGNKEELLLSDSSDDYEATLQRLLDSNSLMECDYCPRKSDCIMTESVVQGWHTRNGFHYQCMCKEGYQGDGWRCHGIDECQDDPWPCPPVEEGGYCVDTAPDDEEYPLYKCGCRSGFEVWLSGVHGARVCIPEGTGPSYVDNPSTQPSLSYTPTRTVQPSPLPSIMGGCTLCPTKSDCILSSADDPEAYESEADGGKWIRCQCKDGYSGDGYGFRCQAIDECLLEDSPCPSAEDGGFCVNRAPEDGKYNCGCLNGYEAYSVNEHGATSCLNISSPPSSTRSPSVSLSPSATLQPTTSPVPTEQTEIYTSVFLNVAGAAADRIVSEKELIELIFRQTYDELDLDEDNRILQDASMLGILSDSGFVTATDEFTSSVGRRFLEETSTVGKRILEEAASDESNTTNTNGGFLPVSFNYSIWFRLVFQCFGCDKEFIFANDAFRRQLQGKAGGVSFSVFVKKFNEQLVEKKVESIEAVIEVEKEPSKFKEFLPPTRAPTPFPTPFPTRGDTSSSPYSGYYSASPSPSFQSYYPYNSYDNYMGDYYSTSPSPSFQSYYSQYPFYYPQYPSYSTSPSPVYLPTSPPPASNPSGSTSSPYPVYSPTPPYPVYSPTLPYPFYSPIFIRG